MLTKAVYHIQVETEKTTDSSNISSFFCYIHLSHQADASQHLEWFAHNIKNYLS